MNDPLPEPWLPDDSAELSVLLDGFASYAEFAGLSTTLTPCDDSEPDTANPFADPVTAREFVDYCDGWRAGKEPPQ